MKIGIVNYAYGGVALELIAETDVEYMLLKQIWEHGEMTRGNGETIAPDGHCTGFFLQTEKDQPKDEKQKCKN